MKKLTAIFLALALCLSFCTVTAFAVSNAISDGIEAYGQDFPRGSGTNSPSNAWVNEAGYKCYLTDDSSSLIVIKDTSGDQVYSISTDTDIDYDEGENVIGFYEIKEDDDTLYFNIEDNKLVSITFSSDTGSTGSKYGTYKAPTPIESIDLSSISFDAGWTGLSKADAVALFSRYSMGHCSYYDCFFVDMEEAVVNSFTAGEEYMLYLILKADAGYTFPKIVGEFVYSGSITPSDFVSQNLVGNIEISEKYTEVTAHAVAAAGEYIGLVVQFTATEPAPTPRHHHSSTTTTPTVTSATTADAGIAIYGVLTVSSLLGMGWVAKQKH